MTRETCFNLKRHSGKLNFLDKSLVHIVNQFYVLVTSCTKLLVPFVPMEGSRTGFAGN